ENSDYWSIGSYRYLLPWFIRFDRASDQWKDQRDRNTESIRILDQQYHSIAVQKLYQADQYRLPNRRTYRLDSDEQMVAKLRLPYRNRMVDACPSRANRTSFRYAYHRLANL